MVAQIEGGEHESIHARTYIHQQFRRARAYTHTHTHNTLVIVVLFNHIRMLVISINNHGASCAEVRACMAGPQHRCFQGQFQRKGLPVRAVRKCETQYTSSCQYSMCECRNTTKLLWMHRDTNPGRETPHACMALPFKHGKI
jgi:hypothetical protein